jgi:hypothetical protein
MTFGLVIIEILILESENTVAVKLTFYEYIDISTKNKFFNTKMILTAKGTRIILSRVLKRGIPGDQT